MTAMQAALANVRAGRDAMFLPEQAIYTEAPARLARDPKTDPGWLEAACAETEKLAAVPSGERDAATAIFLRRIEELFGGGR